MIDKMGISSDKYSEICFVGCYELSINIGETWFRKQQQCLQNGYYIDPCNYVPVSSLHGGQ